MNDRKRQVSRCQSLIPNRQSLIPNPLSPRGQQSQADVLEPIVSFLVASLLLARMLVPTESADAGDTLWIVQLWLGAGLIWCWMRCRAREFSVHLDWCDIALWLLVAGHVVSALHVVFTVGQKRAAINLLGEWVGLGVMFFLVRNTAMALRVRSHLLTAFTAVAVVLAGFGLWQHYVWYPQTAKEYERLRRELDELTETASRSALSPAQARRMSEIQSEFVEQNVPLHGQERILWEQRLQLSREPFGVFALANTFAGIEAVWFIVLLGSFWDSGDRRRRIAAEARARTDRTDRMGDRRWRIAAKALAAALVLMCLLLTKSRTAWVGLAVSLCLWGWWSVLSRRGVRNATGASLGESPALAGHGLQDGRRSSYVLWGAAMAAIAAVIAGVAITGGLDRFVLSEASKSMQYRLQYWKGTWGVIQEQPVVGAGPGNFRQHYLKHKLPESSEEIADPHNLVLDVWVNGGLAGVVGLFALVVAGATCLLRRQDSTVPAQKPGTVPPFDDGSGWPWLLGSGASFFLVWTYQMLFEAELNGTLLVLLVAWAVAIWLIGSIRVSRAVLACAAASLLIHLLGAGGIGMPAVCQTVLLLVAVGTAPGSSADAQHGTRILRRISGSGIVFGLWTVCLAGMFVACLVFGTLPVLQHSGQLRSGDAAAVGTVNPAMAMRLYRRAAEADPFSPAPLRRMAELTFLQWRNAIEGDLWMFDAVVDLSQQAIDRDPFNPHLHLELGKRCSERFRRTGNALDAAAAERCLSRAFDLYPSSAEIVSALAFAAADSEHMDSARRHATRAIELDEINRRAGHVDKYLSDETSRRLRRFLSGQSVDLPAPNAN